MPVIRIVMKKAVAEPQMLSLNSGDFVRAGAPRKAVYKFVIGLENGRATNNIGAAPIASCFASALINDSGVQKLIETNDYSFQFNSKFQLTVTHIGMREGVGAAETETAIA